MNINSAHGNKWLDIKEKMEADIANETYKSYIAVTNDQHETIKIPNRMPSIAEVADIYGCGKSTAQKVLDELCNDGILVRKKGVGYFIKPLIKNKLKEKQLQTIENTFLQAATTAKNLKVDSDTLRNLFDACVSKVYLQEDFAK